MKSLEPKEPAIYPLDQNGHFNISCNFGCDVDQELKYVFSFYDTYVGKAQVFNFFEGEQFVKSITLKEYLDEFYPDAQRSSVQSINKNFKSTDFVQPLDMPLDCRYDPDFSCEQWLESDFLDYVINRKFELKVTQEFIDGNENARRVALSLLTANAISGISARLAQALQVIIAERFVTAATSTMLAYLLDDTNWYSSSLTPGDVLVFKGGNIIEVRSGSSSGGGSEGGGGWDGGRDVERGFICVTVYTNSGRGDVPQTVCY
ncbi:hypothetical protein PSECIP111951_03449 [Pseudoalteromonas holothuriae]|uniref:Uncharacterized protein n=1 Tax=Pseudoalteromonas holothuriae TaxID=2963714 RepID=A0ABM9GM73_9GAMM|nr:hypothetical protein [Pseudoalteromonas sp. CIP111951]CAH9065838.1 hypothetical protein PSECIP111951_03449 [Pseudoalteromonas sp. CIP111951]